MDELVIENINIILTKCKSKISIIISNSITVDLLYSQHINGKQQSREEM
jgi:hypothetical protein